VDADVIVVGAGLAGLVATAELAAAGRRVILLDQEPEAALGGQAYWSFGGLFLVDSPEQRRLGVRDSVGLAWQDWLGTAGFDRDSDELPRQWARAYLEFSAGELRSWLRQLRVRLFPVVGWAERAAGPGTAGATMPGPLGADEQPVGTGNSVPRFHIVWGTGPGLVEPFARRVRQAVDEGRVTILPRHQVDRLTVTAGVVDGVAGVVLESSTAPRGVPSPRTAVADFALKAQAVIVASGGIGANHELVRRNWPARLGRAPRELLSGVPDHVDGRMLGITEAAGAALVNLDRMWHYPEGVGNWAPIWSRHGIRILAGPSSVWLDALGDRLPAPLFPGFDSLGALRRILQTGHDHSWFLLTQRILGKEFALSGSEQNPDLTGRSVWQTLRRGLPGAMGPVERFQQRGADFVVADTLEHLVARMNALTGSTDPAAADLLDLGSVRRQVLERDAQLVGSGADDPGGDQAVSGRPGGDPQLAAIRAARRYLGDRLVRVVPPHRLLDPAAGPLVAVRLRVLSRKTLGGLATDLSGRVLRADRSVLPGVYAAGEAAGFGGGGIHGYRALEGTFLGSCLFTGRTAGRSLGTNLG